VKLDSGKKNKELPKPEEAKKLKEPGDVKSLPGGVSQLEIGPREKKNVGLPTAK